MAKKYFKARQNTVILSILEQTIYPLRDIVEFFADKKTGVCYLVLGNEGGITALVDADGKPIIWEGFDENIG